MEPNLKIFWCNVFSFITDHVVQIDSDGRPIEIDENPNEEQADLLDDESTVLVDDDDADADAYDSEEESLKK